MSNAYAGPFNSPSGFNRPRFGGDAFDGVPGYAGSAALATRPALAAAGTRSVPAFAGTAALARSHPTLSAAAFQATVPLSVGSAALARHPTVNDSAAPLVGWWPLDAIVAGVTPDASAAGNPGTPVGSPPLVPGRFGSALQFNGTQYVTLGDAAALNFEWTQPFAVCCWFRTTSATKGSLVSKEADAPFTGWRAEIQPNGQVAWGVISVSGTRQADVQTTASYNDGAWHHLACTYDGSGRAAGLKVFVDNAPAATAVSLDNLAGGSILTTAPAMLAACSAGSFSRFTGALDDVRVFGGVLSAAGIALAYANATQATFVPQAGSAALLRPTHPALSAAATSRATGDYRATAALTPRRTLAVAATATVPRFTATAPLRAAAKVVAASGPASAPTFAGSAALLVDQPALAGSSDGTPTLGLAIAGSAHPMWLATMTLAMRGSTVPAYPAEGSSALATHGKATATSQPGNVPLVVKVWSPVSRQAPLTISGPVPAAGGTTLAVAGPAGRAGTLGLHVAVAPAPAAAAAAPLAVYGDDGTARGGIVLCAAGWEPDDATRRPLHLAIVGSDRGGTSALLGLGVRGGGAPAAAGITLVLPTGDPAAASAPLAVAGAGTNPNFVPAGGPLHLHVARGPQAGCTLVVANAGAGGSAPLTIRGAPAAYAAATLAVEGLGGSVFDSVDLIIPYVLAPVAATAAAPLAVPATAGAAAADARLAVSGWEPS